MPDTANQHSLLLGFDYGLKQIGVAVGQTLTRQARPLCNLKARDGIPDWQQIRQLLDEWQPRALVVGLPLNMDGSASEMSARAEKFARRLHGRFNIAAHTHDERLSTFAAKQNHYEEHGSKIRDYRNNPVDAMAAAMILQGFMEHQYDNQSK